MGKMDCQMIDVIFSACEATSLYGTSSLNNDDEKNVKILRKTQ